MEDLLKDLNEPQQLAVQYTQGPVMIIAGAGSGKTRVLTYRIAYLLRMGIDPYNILALTFTNKAAREMRNRITKLSSDDAHNLWMGTFHSVFAKILRIEADKLNYPRNFTIYDTDDSKSLIRTILKEQNLDDKIYKPSSILTRISSAKNNLISVQEYMDNINLVNEDSTSGKPMRGELYRIYQERCFKAGAMDFDDLLFNMYVLLKTYPDVLHKYQNKFKYVLVDEFQDTNYAQYVIVRKLSAVHQNICVVGDDSQSIYAFRGANIQNILSFAKDYPDLQTFRLEQNYRSTSTLVNAANSVIEKNKNRLEKKIWTANDEGIKIKVMCALTDNEEGKLVASEIFSEKMTHQLMHSDFAVLYRTNAQSRSMEEALRKINIPYRIYGGLSFYNRKEVKDMLAYFRLAVNPKDEEALKRVINYPKREIGQTSFEKLIVAADKHSISIWEAMEKIHVIGNEINTGTRNRISDFVTMIKSFHVMLKTHTAYDLAGYIASSSGLLRELYTDKSPEGISRYENLQELLNGIKEFTETGNKPITLPDEDANDSPRSLDKYMEDISLLTDAENKDDGKTDFVSLMTVHMAKGLEFKHVFVTGLEENLFPSQLSMSSRADLEEERRLFYVAITRAEKKLTLSFTQNRFRWGNLITCEPSRFLSEIDEQYLDGFMKEEPVQWDDTPNWNDFGNNGFQTKTFKQKTASNSQPKTHNAHLPPRFTPLKKRTSQAVTEQDFIGDDVKLITAGMEVEHQKFGKGKVVGMEGRFPDNKATVFFPSVGQKQLLLKYAKLKILG